MGGRSHDGWCGRCRAYTSFFDSDRCLGCNGPIVYDLNYELSDEEE